MNIHTVTDPPVPSPTPDEDDFHELIEQDNYAIIDHVTQRNPLLTGYLHRLLSNNDTQNLTTPPADNNTPSLANIISKNCITLNATQYRYVSNFNISYCHSYGFTNKGPFVDCSANGGLCGTNIRIIEKTGRSVDIQGIHNPQITDVPIITAGAVVHIQFGSVIIILNQYAYTGNGKPSISLESLTFSIMMSIISL